MKRALLPLLVLTVLVGPDSALPCAVCNPEGQTDPSHSREGSLTTDIRKMLNKNVITTADSLEV